MKILVRKLGFLTLLSLFQFFSYSISAAQENPLDVKIKDEKENTVVIRYTPKASDKINKPDSLFLVFGPSPVQHDKEELHMKKVDDSWVVTYKPPQYPSFSSFYLESPNGADMGPDNDLYEISLDQDSIIKSIPAPVWRQQMLKKLKAEKIKKKAPPLNGLVDLAGDPIDLEKFKDKVLVIDFWATWCSPCLEAFPYLNRVYNFYSGNSEVKFIVVNSALGDSIEDAQKWEKKNDYSFPVYFAQDRIFTDAFNVRSMPTTLIIGKDGYIHFKKIGFDGANFEQLMKLKIDLLLDNI